MTDIKTCTYAAIGTQEIIGLKHQISSKNLRFSNPFNISGGIFNLKHLSAIQPDGIFKSKWLPADFSNRILKILWLSAEWKNGIFKLIYPPAVQQSGIFNSKQPSAVQKDAPFNLKQGAAVQQNAIFNKIYHLLHRHISILLKNQCPCNLITVNNYWESLKSPYSFQHSIFPLFQIRGEMEYWNVGILKKRKFLEMPYSLTIKSIKL